MNNCLFIHQAAKKYLAFAFSVLCRNYAKGYKQQETHFLKYRTCSNIAVWGEEKDDLGTLRTQLSPSNWTELSCVPGPSRDVSIWRCLHSHRHLTLWAYDVCGHLIGNHSCDEVPSAFAERIQWVPGSCWSYHQGERGPSRQGLRPRTSSR